MLTLETSKLISVSGISKVINKLCSMLSVIDTVFNNHTTRAMMAYLSQKVNCKFYCL